jgi:hypothetical protein
MGAIKSEPAMRGKFGNYLTHIQYIPQIAHASLDAVAVGSDTDRRGRRGASTVVPMLFVSKSRQRSNIAE